MPAVLTGHAPASTIECIPELLDLLWRQFLAAAHNAQHLFALDLALPFAGGLRLCLLAIGRTVEELGQDFKARIGGGGVAGENRRDNQKVLQGAAPAVPATCTYSISAAAAALSSPAKRRALGASAGAGSTGRVA